MPSQPDSLSAIQPAHLPDYTHAAVIVGSVIILAIVTLVAGVSLAIAHRLVSAGPMTQRDQSFNIRWTKSGCGVTLAATGSRADTSAASPPV